MSDLTNLGATETPDDPATISTTTSASGGVHTTMRTGIDDDGPGATPTPLPLPTDAEQPIPPDLRGKVTVPDELPGHYMVLWARKPPRGQRPEWHEIEYVKASGPAVARARVLEHDGRAKPIAERGELARYLIEQAGVKPGILLRAVPAVDWTGEGAEPWSMVRREPELGIG